MVLKQASLQSLSKKVKWGTEKKMAFSQGFAINTVIKRYKIPAIKWGHSFNVIGVETNKQQMFWRDNGGELVFLGLLDNEDK